MQGPEDSVASRFVTDTAIEVPAVTTDQMRDIDRLAVEETGPNLYQMMEDAGRNLARLALERLGTDWRQGNIVVLAGSGGNGGGGICAARHLANHGARVSLCLAAPERLGEAPAYQHKIFQATAGTDIAADRIGELQPALILDALIGYSLRSAPRGVVEALIGWANESGAPIVSLDVPSGVDATTGEAPGEYIRAGCTMTLALPKTAWLPARLERCSSPTSAFRRWCTAGWVFPTLTLSTTTTAFPSNSAALTRSGAPPVRVSQKEAARPIAVPTRVSRKPRPTTNCRMSRRWAPSAMRTPISSRRWLTE
jgi:NAD(P)H-hydrate epimerase